MLFRIAAALASLLFAGPVHAQSIVHQVWVHGVTANTEVLTGDPCGTGLSGPNACNDQAIEIAWSIHEDAAPADAEPAPDSSYYVAYADSPFLFAAVTINGRAFPLLAGPTSNRIQTVELWDELNVSGVTDRIQFMLTGSNGSPDSFVGANLLLDQAIDGDGLDELAGPFAGTPVFGGVTIFALENEAGRVIGQYVVRDVAIGVPEPGPSSQHAGAALALACAAHCRGRRRR